MPGTADKDMRAAAPANGTVGFALGGLGGFNAYGVGFLQAARQLKVTPDIITCTSGMIAWVARWLDGEDLEPLILEKCREDSRFPPSLGWLDMLSVAWFGSSGISRSALPEYVARLLTPLTTREEVSEQVLDRLLPAQVWVPVRELADMEHIAGVLNNSPVPVAFNTVHLKSGRPYLHINPAAQGFLNVTDEEIGQVGGPQKYAPISTETVGGGLWVYFFGYDNAAQRRLNPLGLADGAYNRQFIISELTGCDRIYAVRPLNTSWLDHPPRDYFDNENFKIWLWLNSAYTTEVAGMETINKLIQKGDLQAPGYKPIELIEVQIPLSYGPFQQLYERKGVYELAFNEATSELQEHEKAAPPAAEDRQRPRLTRR